MQKKWIATLLVVMLALGGGLASAELTSEEVYSFVEGIYQTHLFRHSFISMIDSADADTLAALQAGENPPRVEMTVIMDSYDTLIACGELQTPDIYILPGTAEEIRDLFLTYWVAAQSLSENSDTKPLDIERFDGEYGGDISLRVMASGWWHEGERDGYRLYVGPVYLSDGDGNIIDDTIYALGTFFEPDRTRIFLISDLDLVCSLFEGLGVPEENSSGSKFFKQWLADLEGYEVALDGSSNAEPARGPIAAAKAAEEARIAAEEAAAEAARLAAEEAERLEAWRASFDILGTVRITNGSTVNLRNEASTDSGIADKGNPGQVFDCVGIAENGWYEVLLETQTAFVSPKVSEFTEK